MFSAAARYLVILLVCPPAIADICEQCASVAAIDILPKDQQNGISEPCALGTGIVLISNGITVRILTAKHLLTSKKCGYGASSPLRVRLNGDGEFLADAVYAHDMDAALITIQAVTLKGRFRSATLSASEDLRVDDRVRVTARDPAQTESHTVPSWFRVIELGADCARLETPSNAPEAPKQRRTGALPEFYFQGDLKTVTVLAGFSGGAVLDEQGRVVGLILREVLMGSGCALALSNLTRADAGMKALLQPLLASPRSVPIPRRAFDVYVGFTASSSSDGFSSSRLFRTGSALRPFRSLPLHATADIEPVRLDRSRFGAITDIRATTFSVGAQVSPWARLFRRRHLLANAFAGMGWQHHWGTRAINSPTMRTGDTPFSAEGFYIEAGTRYFPVSR